LCRCVIIEDGNIGKRDTHVESFSESHVYEKISSRFPAKNDFPYLRLTI
jgi:hypothetical protein